MNPIIKIIIGTPLIGIFSLWAAYMLVGLVVVGLVSLRLPAFPGCLLSASLEGGYMKIPPCPSIFSYSIESLFIVVLFIAIGMFFFLFRLIYKNKQK